MLLSNGIVDYIVPKMKLLHKIVIPKVSSKWKRVADFLEVEFSKIDMIQDKFKSDPNVCCEEALREWLRSDYGVQPKTWSTLIATLREIKELTTITEEIEQELKSKNMILILSLLQYKF